MLSERRRRTQAPTVVIEDLVRSTCNDRPFYGIGVAAGGESGLWT